MMYGISNLYMKSKIDLFHWNNDRNKNEKCVTFRDKIICILLAPFMTAKKKR